MHREIKAHRGGRLSLVPQKVKQLAASHGLTNLRVFGSVARGEETEDSDIDLLVDVKPGVGLIGMARAQHEVEELLGTRVDLVPASDLKPRVSTCGGDPALSRFDDQRLEDICTAAIDAIQGHLGRGELSEGLIFDAVRIRLIEIGEAVKALSMDVVANEPEIPWNGISKYATGSLIATSTLRTQSWPQPSKATFPSSRVFRETALRANPWRLKTSAIGTTSLMEEFGT